MVAVDTSQFPYFSLIKIQFLQPNKYKMSDILKASCLPLQSSFDTFSTNFASSTKKTLLWSQWPRIFLQAFSGITCRSAMSNNFYFLWFFFKNCLSFYSKSSSLFLPRNFSLQQLCNPWQPYEWLPAQTKSQDLTHWIELYLIVVHYSHSFQCHQTTERKSNQISLTNQVRGLYCK